MGFKYYEQNQLMIPMEWKTLIDKEDVVFVLNDLIDNMNIDKLLETYSPLGSSSYSPKMMLKILMYGYIRKRYSSRQIAEAVQCDIKFIWLAGGNKPTRNVINSFRKDKMKIIMEDVFVELLVVLEKKGYINTEEYFVDGTKVEANANKYTFVWKKAVEKYKAKLQEQVHELMKEIDNLNEEEDKLYPDKEIKPEEITPEELEEFSKRLSDKLNEGLEKQKSKEDKTETGFVQEIRVYECSNCSSCKCKSECTKAKGNRKISFNKKLWKLKHVAKRNLMSEKGREMRGKRAEYSEGIFGQIKWNMGFKRFLLRGLDKVDLEWGLLCFALNIKRMNKKDIEKLKETAPAKALFLSRNIINFSTRKSNSYRAGFSGFRVPILGHPLCS